MLKDLQVNAINVPRWRSKGAQGPEERKGRVCTIALTVYLDDETCRVFRIRAHCSNHRGCSPAMLVGGRSLQRG